MDCKGRRRNPADLVGHTRTEAYDRPGPLVAFFGQLSLGPERRSLLRADFHERAMASDRAGDMGCFSKRAVDRPPICLIGFPRGAELDSLQFLAATHLFRDR